MNSTAFASWYPNVVGAQRHASSSTTPLSQAEREGASARVVYTPERPAVRVDWSVWLGESRARVRVGEEGWGWSYRVSAAELELGSWGFAS